MLKRYSLKRESQCTPSRQEYFIKSWNEVQICQFDNQTYSINNITQQMSQKLASATLNCSCTNCLNTKCLEYTFPWANH